MAVGRSQRLAAEAGGIVESALGVAGGDVLGVDVGDAGSGERLSQLAIAAPSARSTSNAARVALRREVGSGVI